MPWLRYVFIGFVDYYIITAAIKHINCHAGLDPASRSIPDSRCHENHGFDIYCCRSNNRSYVDFIHCMTHAILIHCDRSTADSCIL